MMLEIENHPNITLIDMKFLVPGHTYMNVDGVPGVLNGKKEKSAN